uniref:NADH-ubiquinone oxidoreductase chain 2 n=1 Tax=Demodex brevis TaxID=574145 RepID=A0A0A7DTT5_DEMBR|nr:NADH dehydrogenase subunit 2 [Demodex brevis]
MKTPLSMLLITSMLGISSNSWLFLWLMIEINTPMFSFMLSSTKENPKNPLNYFIIQSLTSLTMFIILISTMTKYPTTLSNKTLNISMHMIAFIKMGLMPTHNWMMNMMKSMKKTSLSTLMTVQKILPLKITSMITTSQIIQSILLMNLILSSITIMQTTKTNHLLLMSSIHNISWTTLNIQSLTKISTLFFTIYSLMTISLISNLSLTNKTSLNLPNKNSNINLIISIMAISGLPPMWGFMSKFMMIQSMYLSNTPTLTLLTLLNSSILMLSGYLKLCYNMMMTNTKMKTKIPKNSPWLLISNLISPSMIILI